MEKLIKDSSAKTPQIAFDAEAGKLESKGRSIPENSLDFYIPLKLWVDDYLKSPQIKTILDVKLEYFNTSSSKCILDIFKKLESLTKSGFEVEINWYYEADDDDDDDDDVDDDDDDVVLVVVVVVVLVDMMMMVLVLVLVVIVVVVLVDMMMMCG